jgi:hypothetical protein
VAQFRSFSTQSAESAPTRVASGRTGVRAKAVTPVRARNRLQCALARFPLGYRFRPGKISEAARDRPERCVPSTHPGPSICAASHPKEWAVQPGFAKCLSRNRLGPPTFWDKMQATALAISRNPFANARRPAVSPRSRGGEDQAAEKAERSTLRLRKPAKPARRQPLSVLYAGRALGVLLFRANRLLDWAKLSQWERGRDRGKDWTGATNRDGLRRSAHNCGPQKAQCCSGANSRARRCLRARL